MKKILSLTAIIYFLAVNAQTASLTECENLLRTHQYENSQKTWKHFNIEANYGEILRKEISYMNPENPELSKTYWLFQVKNTGHFYFGNLHSKKEEPRFYANENNAIVALFVWQCSKVYLDEGLVSNLE